MPVVGPGPHRARRRWRAPETAFRGARHPYRVSRIEGDAALLSTTPVTKTIVIATKGKYAIGTRAATSLDSSITSELVAIGPASATELSLEVNNWWLLATASAEQINSGALDVEASLVDALTGRRARFSWGGGATGSVPITPGAARRVSDPLLPSTFGLTLFPAGSHWLLIVRRTAAGPSDQLPWDGSNQLLNRPREFQYQYAAATSAASAIAEAYLDAAPPLEAASVAATKSLGTIVSAPNTGATSLGVGGGFLLLGKANAPTRAVVIVGDSISDGTSDVQSIMPTDSGNGWVGRCLTDLDGSPIASAIKATMPGDRAQYRASLRTLTRNAYRQANIGVIALGVNDLAGGRTFAQLRDDVYAIAADMKADGIATVLAASVTPKTTSTDGFVTTANQSAFSAAFLPSGARDQFNAQMAANAAAKTNNIDGFIDLAAAVEDPDSPGRWRSPGYTTDGTHPTALGHAAMAEVARTALLGVAAGIA